MSRHSERSPFVPAVVGAQRRILNGQQYIVVATGGSNLPAELIAFKLS